MPSGETLTKDSMTQRPCVKMLSNDFFNCDALLVARDLLGKVIFHYYQNQWLAVRIIETEAYKLDDKASHASLGFTEKRQALFMPPGTIYMYYARGGDSLNISVQGQGCAVLVKSGVPHVTPTRSRAMLECMHQLNPKANGQRRDLMRLCSGQTLLCRALNLKVTQWDQQQFDPNHFYIADCDYQPEKIIQTTRLGIPNGRDGHLPYRFIDHAYAKSATLNPLTKRVKQYQIISPSNHEAQLEFHAGYEFVV